MEQTEIEEKLKKWRLVLGGECEEQLSSMGSGQGTSLLSEEEKIMDDALAAIYDETTGEIGGGKSGGGRAGGAGKSAPNLAKWLTDVRNFFPEDVVSVI